MDQALKQQASDLLASELKGLGEKRLAALGLPLLEELVRRLGFTPTDDDSVECLVKFLIKKKRNKQVAPVEKDEEKTTAAFSKPQIERAEFQSPSFRRPAAERPATVGPESSPTTSAPLGSRVFKHRHSITVVAFNALKLRLDHGELHEAFGKLAARFAEADIVMISEVACGSQRTAGRVASFKSMLSSHGSEWTMVVSEPSGPGNPEMHLVLAKAPISVVRYVTNSTADGVALDHSPLSVLVEDLRFGDFGRLVLTSVHFPPESRARQRDSQIASFLKCYRTQSAMRCDTPFTLSGATDARVKLPVHIIGGDFNAWIGDDRYRTSTLGYEATFGQYVPTTSGNRAFDNFLLSSHTRDHFTISCKVLQLENPQNSHKGVRGLSDHDPVMLILER